MAQRLRRGGLTVEEYAFSQQSVGRLAIALHTAIRDHRIVLPDDEELIDELANVRLRETSPGVLRMDHDSDRHDDRAISLALAVRYLAETAGGPATLSIPVGRMPSTKPQGLGAPVRVGGTSSGLPAVSGTYPPGTPAWQKRLTSRVRARPAPQPEEKS
jgi:hypothetical protein